MCTMSVCVCVCVPVHFSSCYIVSILYSSYSCYQCMCAEVYGVLCFKYCHMIIHAYTLYIVSCRPSRPSMYVYTHVYTYIDFS